VKPPFALTQSGDFERPDLIGDDQMGSRPFELLENFLAAVPEDPARRRGAVEFLLAALEEPTPKTWGTAKQPPIRANVQHEEPRARYLQHVYKVDLDGFNAIVQRTLKHFRRPHMPRADTQRYDEDTFRSHVKQESGVRSQESE